MSVVVAESPVPAHVAAGDPGSGGSAVAAGGPGSGGSAVAAGDGEAADVRVDRPRRPLALSPSRAGDFKTCPLLYRLRAVDRLPEVPSGPAVRGTLVHAVLERMFGRPGPERTPDATVATIGPVWDELRSAWTELTDLVPDADLGEWLAGAEELVRSYFTLEDPTRLTPEACELAVEIEVGEGVPLRGFIDRLDLAPTGQLRVVDYKTGRSPDPDFEARALYQLKFYALMIYRLRGVVPAQLKLIYLGDVRSLQYTPTESELIAFETGVVALWAAIRRALESGHFPPRRSRMCEWCSYQSICPEFGGTPPPYPGPPVTDNTDDTDDTANAANADHTAG